MQNDIFTLKNILDSISKYKKPDVKKRLIFDQSPIGGLGSKWVISFFLLLPFLEAAGIFNPWMYKILGIAQAIIFFIVFLSIVMILIFTIASLNNAKVVKKITTSWDHYFPDIDLKLIVTSGATPYKEFFTHYAKALNAELKDEALHTHLAQAFVTMQEENKDLIEAMQRDTSR